MLQLLLSLNALLVLTGSAAYGLKPLSPVDIFFSKLEQASRQESNALRVQADLAAPHRTFSAQYFTQPLDHFLPNQSLYAAGQHTWRQRYWVNDRHYRPGGPVIVLDGGETSGEDRLPFLDTGIGDILPRETGGLGVVLEHRYYGESIPVQNFTTDSLRWLNNAQSAADSANFMANVKFPGIDEDITAPRTPWIYYGGSYAGARAAHMKILYPDLVWGAIASSAVTNAIIDNYEYYEIIADYADPHCISTLRHSILLIDHYLGSAFLSPWVKSLFGLSTLSNLDFATVLTYPTGLWQGKNWDSEAATAPGRWEEFCEDLTKGAGKGSPGSWRAVRNYAKWIKKNIVSLCPKGQTVEDCFGTSDPSKLQDTSLDQTWRAWTFQVCTEWGYFHQAPPYPSIVSQYRTVEVETKSCQAAFPNGEHFIVPAWPNVTVVNELGDYGIAADRLALIDGEWDPWRPRTPHSWHAKPRNDTVLRPFKQIPTAVHHYDENGLRDSSSEPPYVRKIHAEEIAFVKSWLKDFEEIRTVQSSGQI